MSTELPSSFAILPPMQAPLTVDQYNRMIETGILEEGAPIELLNGMLMVKDRSARGEDPMTVGNEHALIVIILSDLSAAFRKRGCHIRPQQPISIPPFHAPEPDAAIVRGKATDFASGHPTATDVLAVIEVADSSLNHDRTDKLIAYAKAGIPLYLIINLQDRVIERYTKPLASGRYAQSEELSPRGSVELPTAKAPLKIPVKRLLP